VRLLQVWLLDEEANCKVYIIEMSHPAYRGRLGGLYNCCYSVGGITASGALRGAVKYNNNLAWLIPVWLQLIWSSVVVLSVWFFPESPRWYYAHGNPEKARNMLVKYHGQGNVDSPFVALQMAEFESEIRENASDKRFWDYRELFNSRASMYRILCSCIVTVFAQWSGILCKYENLPR